MLCLTCLFVAACATNVALEDVADEIEGLVGEDSAYEDSADEDMGDEIAARQECRPINAGKKCIFPFKFENKTCPGPKCCNLDNDSEGSWCATEVDDDRNMIDDMYAYCAGSPCDPGAGGEHVTCSKLAKVKGFCDVLWDGRKESPCHEACKRVTCVDKDVRCPGWVAAGYCKNEDDIDNVFVQLLDPETIKTVENCRKSCGVCHLPSATATCMSRNCPSQ